MTVQATPAPRVKDIHCQAEQAFWLERQARIAELCAAIESAHCAWKSEQLVLCFEPPA